MQMIIYDLDGGCLIVEGSVSSTDISSDEINQLKAQIVDCFDGLLVN